MLHDVPNPSKSYISLLRDKPDIKLFDLEGGVNEFECIFVDGYFYFFVHIHEKSGVRVARAKSIEELASADYYEICQGYYPTALFINNIWHIWVYIEYKGIVLYTSNLWNSGFEFHSIIDNTGLDEDNPRMLKGDARVRQNHNGEFVLCYKWASYPHYCGYMIAPTPLGPWTDRGAFFEEHLDFHDIEEADPAIHFAANGEIYLTFAGVIRPNIQCICIAKLDSNYRPLNSAEIIIQPVENWHNSSGNGPKIFNPVLIEYDNVTRLLYAHNPKTAAVSSGWGYREFIRS